MDGQIPFKIINFFYVPLKYLEIHMYLKVKDSWKLIK